MLCHRDKPSSSSNSSAPSSSQGSSESGIKTKITHLNDDCLFHIFQFVSNVRDLIQLRQVCKVFKVPVSKVLDSIKMIHYPYRYFFRNNYFEKVTLYTNSTERAYQMFDLVPFYWFGFDHDEALRIECLLNALKNLKVLIELSFLCQLRVDLSSIERYRNLEFISLHRGSLKLITGECNNRFFLKLLPNLKYVLLEHFEQIHIENLFLRELEFIDINLTEDAEIFVDNHIEQLRVLYLHVYSRIGPLDRVRFDIAWNLRCLCITGNISLEQFRTIVNTCPIKEIEFGGNESQPPFMEYFRLIAGTQIFYFRQHFTDFRIERELVRMLKQPGYRQLKYLQFMRLKDGQCLEAHRLIIDDYGPWKSFLRENPLLKKIHFTTVEAVELLETIIEARHQVKIIIFEYIQEWNNRLTDLMKSPYLKNIEKIGETLFENGECTSLDARVFPRGGADVFEYFLLMNHKITRIFYSGNEANMDYVTYLLKAISKSNVKPEELAIFTRIVMTREIIDLLKSPAFESLRIFTESVFAGNECLELSDVMIHHDNFGYFLERNKNLRVIDKISIIERVFNLNYGTYNNLLESIIENGIKIERISVKHYKFGIKGLVDLLKNPALASLKEIDGNKFENNTCTVLHITREMCFRRRSQKNLTKFLENNEGLREIHFHWVERVKLLNILQLIAATKVKLEVFTWKVECRMKKAIITLLDTNPAFNRLYEFKYKSLKPRYERQLRRILRRNKRAYRRLSRDSSQPPMASQPQLENPLPPSPSQPKAGCSSH